MIENTYLVNREKKLGKKGKRKQNLSLNQVNKSDNKCFFFFFWKTKRTQQEKLSRI